MYVNVILRVIIEYAYYPVVCICSQKYKCVIIVKVVSHNQRIPLTNLFYGLEVLNK